LDLSYSELTDVGITALATTCIHNLVNLQLQWNQISHQGVIALADELKQNAAGCPDPSLLAADRKILAARRLSMTKTERRMSINQNENHFVPQHKQRNNKLEVLNLNFNKIGGLGGAAIAEILLYNKSLLTLSCANNNINWEVSERSERALMKTRILAMKCANSYRRLHLLLS